MAVSEVAVALRSVGAFGVFAGVAVASFDGVLLSIMLTANTLNLYSCPFVSPVMVAVIGSVPTGTETLFVVVPGHAEPESSY